MTRASVIKLVDLLIPITQDFHHDVTLKRVLVEYLTGVKEQYSVQDKETELADGLLK